MSEQTTNWARATVLVVLAFAQWILAQNPEWVGLTLDIARTSNAAPSPLIPPFWSFTVWNVLYAGSILFALWHLISSDRAREPIQRAGWWIAGSFFANCAWSIVYPTIGPGVVSYALLIAGPTFSITGLWMLRNERFAGWRDSLPFIPIYALAGWQSIASTVALSQVPVITGFVSTTALALTILAVGTAVILLLQRTLMSIFYVATVAWGLFGVTLKNLTGDNAMVGIAAMAALVIAISYTAYLKGRSAATLA